MNIKDVTKKILETFPETKAVEKFGNQIEIISNKKDFVGLISTLKIIEFRHLSNITCVDWIEDKGFDVIYNIWSYKHKIHLTVKVPINREEPKLTSIHTLWPQAQVYEREIH